MNAGDRDERQGLSALAVLLKAVARRPNSVELDRGLAALRARLAGDRSRARGAPRWAPGVAAFTLIAVLGAGAFAVLRERAFVPTPPVALSRIEGGRVLEGGYLAASGNEGIHLFFDEGSQFILEPGTRGRLRQVDAQGARLAIEQGSASLRITENQKRRWTVESGPFLVTVKGTDFTVSWQPESERFEVRLRRGRVDVQGPMVGEGLTLRPGQRLIVNLPKAEMTVSEEPYDEPRLAADLPRPLPNSSASVGVAPSTDVGAAPLASAAPRTVSSSANALPERRWREAVANGEWDRVLAQADRDGVDATLRSASSDDLFALADAARYRRRTDLARATLLAQRSRFPSSARSLDAAFLLGRVEESRPSGRSQAIAWYEEYLVRAPTGTYAAEALGRKLILTKELSGTRSARPIAAEYLRRFPEGSYAGTARALQELPGTKR